MRAATLPTPAPAMPPPPVQVRWTDWLVEFETIEFLRQPEGGYQELGSGGYGTVYRVMLDGVQVRAACWRGCAQLCGGRGRHC